jgi:hypothetical protein
MENLNVLLGATALLAIIGYYHCLNRHFLMTLVATATFAAYLVVQVPFESIHILYWAAAALLVGGLSWLSKAGVAPPLVAPKEKRGKGREIVIDGTNVLYWDGDGAQITTLRIVVEYLNQKNFAPIVFFDASARHHLGDKSLDEASFAKALGLAKGSVIVCPAKTEADVFILKYAREQNLPIVSNDKFRDRAQQTKGLNIVKGVLASGRPILTGLPDA